MTLDELLTILNKVREELGGNTRITCWPKDWKLQDPHEARQVSIRDTKYMEIRKDDFRLRKCTPYIIVE